MYLVNCILKHQEDILCGFRIKSVDCDLKQKTSEINCKERVST